MAPGRNRHARPWIDDPEVQENLFTDAAGMIRNAQRLAIALEQPAIAAICERVTTPSLALPVAQCVPTECLNALQKDRRRVNEAAQRYENPTHRSASVVGSCEIATLGRWIDDPDIQENLFTEAVGNPSATPTVSPIALEQPAVVTASG